MKPVVWTIAGADSSGAAGATADLKTFAALGVHGASVLTAVTAQGLSTFDASMPVDGSMIRAQIKALANLPAPKAIKVGMLPTAEAVEEVADFLIDYPGSVVLDPVVSSSSGGFLTGDSAIAAVKNSLLARVDLLTPNAAEAERLLGVEVRTAREVEAAAARALSLGVRHVLIKGGHVSGLTSSDYFRGANGHGYWIHSRKTEGAYVRGTGCALSAAVAAGLARGLALEDAVVLAKGYVTRGIRESYGPVDARHFFAHGPWPVASDDMPWIARDSSLARLSFPSTGPEPLGFYPVVPSAEWVERLVAAGARAIQLRLKDSGRAVEEIARAVGVAEAAGVRLFVNGHWREAIAAHAYGIHLEQEDLEAADLGALEAAGLRLGVSTHSLRQAALANALGASYVAIGPEIGTAGSATSFSSLELERIAEWRALFDVPVVATHGLKVGDVAAVRALGVDGIAVSSDFVEHADPKARVLEWLRATGAIS